MGYNMDEPEYNEKFVEEILAADRQEPEGYLQPLPYTEPSKELQDLFKFIDEAMAEVVNSIALESEMLKDKVSAVLKTEAHERLKLETFDRIMQDKE
jgi:hypothetical protein